jgi:hypothetical protein
VASTKSILEETKIQVARGLAVRSACSMFAPSAPCDSAWMLSRTLCISKQRIASSNAMYMNCPLYSLNLCPSMAVCVVDPVLVDVPWALVPCESYLHVRFELLAFSSAVEFFFLQRSMCLSYSPSVVLVVVLLCRRYLFPSAMTSVRYTSISRMGILLLYFICEVRQSSPPHPFSF